MKRTRKRHDQKEWECRARAVSYLYILARDDDRSVLRDMQRTEKRCPLNLIRSTNPPTSHPHHLSFA